MIPGARRAATIFRQKIVASLIPVFSAYAWNLWISEWRIRYRDRYHIFARERRAEKETFPFYRSNEKADYFGRTNDDAAIQNAFNWMFNQINKKTTFDNDKHCTHVAVFVSSSSSSMAADMVWLHKNEMSHCYALCVYQMESPYRVCYSLRVGYVVHFFDQEHILLELAVAERTKNSIQLKWKKFYATTAAAACVVFVCVWPKSFRFFYILFFFLFFGCCPMARAPCSALRANYNMIGHWEFEWHLLLFAHWCPDDWCNWICYKR